MAGLAQMHGSLLASSSASLRGLSLPQKQQHQQQPARRCSSSVVRVVAEDSKFALNPSIQKESDKVTDTVALGDLSKPTTAYCRCWRSGTFPLCDGTHAKYNKSSGDNVGPLLLKK